MSSTVAFASPVGVLAVRGGPAGIRVVGWGTLPVGEPDAVVQQAAEQLREYLAGERRVFDLPLDPPPLSATTRAVLTALRTVGYGETITYGELAVRSGTGLPARAVGAVMGANPLPLLIPCHRVVASDGLGGYSGGEPGQGLATKRWLLELEGVLVPALF